MILRNFIIFGIGRFIPDKLWIQLKFFQCLGRFVDFKNPRSYNEKLQWLKLYDRRPEYTGMVDKYEAKQYVADRIGQEYVIPLLGGPWNNFDEIEFDKLPAQFVLKTTHDCGGVVICKDKAGFDKDAARKFLRRHLRTDYYLPYREWPYKNVKPRIFAEAYMRDDGDGQNSSKQEQLTDYKFFCFDGVPKVLLIVSDREDAEKETRYDFFDMDFKHLPITNGHPNAAKPPECPETFDQMCEIASKLSTGIPQSRIDLYDVGGHIYFGEITLFRGGGFMPFEPKEWDYIFGDWITLPKKV